MENEFRITVDLSSLADNDTGNSGVASADKKTAGGDFATQIGKSAKGLLSIASVGKAIDTIYALKSQEIQIVTGQTQLQQRREFVKSLVDVGVTAGAATVGALATGIATGGASLVVGALVAGASFATSAMLKANELNLKEYAENQQIEAMKTRAGIGFNIMRENKNN